MVTNQIIKLNLEPRVRDLKNENKSEREIAAILSEEMNQKITKSAVHRYLAGNVKLAQEAIEANNKLKVRVAEIELNTVEARREVIDKIKKLAEKAESEGDYKTTLYALKISITALESLDERLGDLNRTPQVNVQVEEFHELRAVVISELCNNCKQRLKGRLHELAGK